MTKAEIDQLLVAANIIAGVVSPTAGLVADVIGIALTQTALLQQDGTLTEEQVSDIRTRAKVEDDRWDAIVAKARGTET